MNAASSAQAEQTRELQALRVALRTVHKILTDTGHIDDRGRVQAASEVTAQYTADVSAWARERLAEAMLSVWHDPAIEDIHHIRREADAVLAVLPELLTDERVVDEVAADTSVAHNTVYHVLARGSKTLAGAS